MKKIAIECCGKVFETEAFATVQSVLVSMGLMDNELDYLKNPIVGALVNGEAVSLSEPLRTSSVLAPIHVFESLGRRIYRHSISFLLSYAASLVAPQRNLIIGHSLGDGFFFFFDDGNPVEEELFLKIQENMRNLQKAALPISREYLSQEEAVCYFTSHGRKQSVLLLESKNDPEVALYCLENYYGISYEPLVPNTAILSLWELRPYGNGLLLRYPVSENVKGLVPFRDNPLLFSVFQEYAKWGEILGIKSIGEMNRKNSVGTIGEYVRLSEDLHRRKIASIADAISLKKAKVVFVAGPSSSGKTTFAKRICEQLRLLGYDPFKISLDDYYNPPYMAPKDAEGNPDLEALEALNLELLDENLKTLVSGRPVLLPSYDFATHTTTFSEVPVNLGDRNIVVIEGIHALNERITGCIDQKYIYRIYISALTQLNLDDANRVSTTDNRILRRTLRDYHTRGMSAVNTLLMWPSVTKGETRNIFPHQNNADVMFNSALDYEIGVLVPYVQPLLRAVTPEAKEAYVLARRLLAFLDNIYPIDSSYVPKDSLLREFIGGSDYE